MEQDLLGENLRVLFMFQIKSPSKINSLMESGKLTGPLVPSVGELEVLLGAYDVSKSSEVLMRFGLTIKDVTATCFGPSSKPIQSQQMAMNCGTQVQHSCQVLPP